MSEAEELRAQLRALQIELIEAAASFDRRGHPDAADFALATAYRIGELCEVGPVLSGPSQVTPASLA